MGRRKNKLRVDVKVRNPKPQPSRDAEMVEKIWVQLEDGTLMTVIMDRATLITQDDVLDLSIQGSDLIATAAEIRSLKADG